MSGEAERLKQAAQILESLAPRENARLRIELDDEGGAFYGTHAAYVLLGDSSA